MEVLLVRSEEFNIRMSNETAEGQTGIEYPSAGAHEASRATMGRGQTQDLGGPGGFVPSAAGGEGVGGTGSYTDAVEVVIPPKRYRIGEVVQHSGLSRQTIHNYTVMGLIRESEWTDGGHRLYSAEVFERLAKIRQLRGRHSLGEIRKMMEEWS